MKGLLRIGTSLVFLLRRAPYFLRFVRLIWRLVCDRRVPLYLKGMLALAILYVLSPFDLIPETFLFIFGLVDDVAILLLAGTYFMRWSPQDVIAEHVAMMDADFQTQFRQWFSS